MCWYKTSEIWAIPPCNRQEIASLMVIHLAHPQEEGPILIQNQLQLQLTHAFHSKQVLTLCFSGEAHWKNREATGPVWNKLRPASNKGQKLFQKRVTLRHVLYGTMSCSTNCKSTRNFWWLVLWQCSLIGYWEKYWST